MITTTKEQLYGFSEISWLKKIIGKKIIFSTFLFQEMSLEREIFINFLPQKFITKYGIVSTYSVAFLSQKILACLQ